VSGSSPKKLSHEETVRKKYKEKVNKNRLEKEEKENKKGKVGKEGRFMKVLNKRDRPLLRPNAANSNPNPILRRDGNPNVIPNGSSTANPNSRAAEIAKVCVLTLTLTLTLTVTLTLTLIPNLKLTLTSLY
jgi:hypothetical protein